MTDIKAHLRLALDKGLLLDLEDRVRAEAVKAFEMIRDHAGLDKKRGRELEGQARFRMMERGFEEVCELHGGRLLDGGVIPHSELRIFQPFMRFDIGGQGIILGLAAMSEPKMVPMKNKSRLAGVSLNYELTPRLDLDGSCPKIGDVFAVFVFSRDRERAGRIEEIAIGVIDSKYKSYLFYETLSNFLSGHGDVAAPTPEPTPPTSSSDAKPSVSLKKVVTPFFPPEAPETKPENADEK